MVIMRGASLAGQSIARRLRRAIKRSKSAAASSADRIIGPNFKMIIYLFTLQWANWRGVRVGQSQIVTNRNGLMI